MKTSEIIVLPLLSGIKYILSIVRFNAYFLTLLATFAICYDGLRMICVIDYTVTSYYIATRAWACNPMCSSYAAKVGLEIAPLVVAAVFGLIASITQIVHDVRHYMHICCCRAKSWLKHLMKMVMILSIFLSSYYVQRNSMLPCGFYFSSITLTSYTRTIQDSNPNPLGTWDAGFAIVTLSLFLLGIHVMMEVADWQSPDNHTGRINSISADSIERGEGLELRKVQHLDAPRLVGGGTTTAVEGPGGRSHEFHIGDPVEAVRRYWGIPANFGNLMNDAGQNVEFVEFGCHFAIDPNLTREGSQQTM